MTTEAMPRLHSNEIEVPQTSATVYEALYGRRNTWQFTGEAPSHETLQRVLSTAVWAPNHKLTEPWRFFVLPQGGGARQQVVDCVYNSALKMSGDPERAKRATGKLATPPVVVFVYSAPGDTEKVTLENYGAVCAAVQNIQLACYAEGLAVGWESGGIVRAEGITDVLGADPSWMCVGFLGIGKPDGSHVGGRIPADALVRWLD